MLAPATFAAELARFSDPMDSTFTGYPPTRLNARQRWAHAFRIYIAQVIDLVGTAPLSPVQASIQTGFDAAVEDAYFLQIRFDNTMTAYDAAVDHADAWRGGMRAFHAGNPGATLPPATTLYTFASWTPTSPPHDIVDQRRDALVLQLTPLFEHPRLVARPRLNEIAAAYHTATVDITALGGAGTIIYH